MPERGQFTFYRAYYEAAKSLPKRDRETFLTAICAYALDGEEPELTGFLSAAFELVRPSLDTGRARANNRLGKTKQEQNKNKSKTNEEQNDNKTTSNKEQTDNKKEQNENGEKKEKSPLLPPLSSPPIPPTTIPPIIPPKEKEKGCARFAPPTVEEVRAYCQERGNGVDPQRFVDFYTCKGWMVGKNKMKDWRSAVRTWERKDAGSAPPPEEPARPKKHWVSTGPFDGYWEEDG